MMKNETLYPCQEVTTRDSYEEDKEPVRKTVTDYAEEICAVLNDPLGTVDLIIDRVKGVQPVKAGDCDSVYSTLGLLQLTLEKAQKLREKLYELGNCV